MRLETFSFIFSKIGQYFHGGGGEWKQKNCGRPTGFNFSHPLDRKQIFFMDSLGVIYMHIAASAHYVDIYIYVSAKSPSNWCMAAQGFVPLKDMLN